LEFGEEEAQQLGEFRRVLVTRKQSCSLQAYSIPLRC